jgi:transcriptional regulator GlxA family with amidase domain
MSPRPVYLVLRRDFLLLDLSAVVEPWRLANEAAGTPLFTFHYLGASDLIASSVGLPVGPVSPFPEELPQDALVVLVGTRSATLAQNRALERGVVTWLRDTVRPTHQVVCVCSGALLAADAGLLDGRECTTHHDFCARLAAQHRSAKVRENRLFVHDGNIFTSAGVTAGIDLALYVLGLVAGERLAMAVARELVVYARRSGDDPQLSPLLAHRNHVHPRVHQIQDAVVKEPQRNWTSGALAAVGQLSVRQVTRVFRQHAGVTPGDYVTGIRLARACELLERSTESVEQLAEASGFGSTRQFRRAFQDRYEMSPSEWRARR